MKYPANTAILTEARMYAIESINYTFDYDGWEDGYEKSTRIITGKYCQLWLTEFCRLNNINHYKDISPPYIHDNGDLFVNGWNIDCKGSVNDAFAGQVSKQFDSVNNTVDYYGFFKTDKSYNFVEPIGFISKKNVLNSSKKVIRGELIPLTNITQKFEYSYFVDITKLTPFSKAITLFKNKPKISQLAA